jgi:hypothetical protein
MGRGDGFEQASLSSFPSVDANRSGLFADLVTRLGAVQPDQRIERPVGVCHHADAALGCYENRDVRAPLPAPGSRFGGVQNVSRALGKLLHDLRIAESGPDSSRETEILYPIYDESPMFTCLWVAPSQWG